MITSRNVVSDGVGEPFRAPSMVRAMPVRSDAPVAVTVKAFSNSKTPGAFRSVPLLPPNSNAIDAMSLIPSVPAIRAPTTAPAIRYVKMRPSRLRYVLPRVTRLPYEAIVANRVVVRAAGLEPARRWPPDFKSGMSTTSITPASPEPLQASQHRTSRAGARA